MRKNIEIPKWDTDHHLQDYLKEKKKKLRIGFTILDSLNQKPKLG